MCLHTCLISKQLRGPGPLNTYTHGPGLCSRWTTTSKWRCIQRGVVTQTNPALVSSLPWLPCESELSASPAPLGRAEGTSHPLSTEPARKPHVLGRDGHAARVDAAEVCVLEEADEVGLGGLLQRQHGLRLELEVCLEILRNL